MNPWEIWLWPWIVASALTRRALETVHRSMEASDGDAALPRVSEPEWASPNHVTIELDAMRGARFFGRAGQATSHSHRCAFRLARREKSAFVIDALQFPGPPANEIDRRTVETFLRWQARLRALGKGLQDVCATGDAAVANHIYSVANRIDDHGGRSNGLLDASRTPDMIGHHEACENKDLRDARKPNRSGPFVWIVSPPALWFLGPTDPQAWNPCVRLEFSRHGLGITHGRPVPRPCGRDARSNARERAPRPRDRQRRSVKAKLPGAAHLIKGQFPRRSQLRARRGKIRRCADN